MWFLLFLLAPIFLVLWLVCDLRNRKLTPLKLDIVSILGLLSNLTPYITVILGCWGSRWSCSGDGMGGLMMVYAFSFFLTNAILFVMLPIPVGFGVFFLRRSLNRFDHWVISFYLLSWLLFLGAIYVDPVHTIQRLNGIKTTPLNHLSEIDPCKKSTEAWANFHKKFPDWHKDPKHRNQDLHSEEWTEVEKWEHACKTRWRDRKKSDQ